MNDVASEQPFRNRNDVKLLFILCANLLTFLKAEDEKNTHDTVHLMTNEKISPNIFQT